MSKYSDIAADLRLLAGELDQTDDDDIDLFAAEERLSNIAGQVEKIRRKIMKKIKSPPPIRDMSITMGRIRGRKESELAEENGISRQMVNKITKKCSPLVAAELRKYEPTKRVSYQNYDDGHITEKF